MQSILGVRGDDAMDVKEHSKTQPAFSEGFVHRILLCVLVLVQAQRHGLGGLNLRPLYLTAVEAGSPRSRGWQADLVPGEDSSCLVDAAFSLCICSLETESQLWPLPLVRTQPHHGSLILMTCSKPCCCCLVAESCSPLLQPNGL